MTDTALSFQPYYCCHTCGFISDDTEEVKEHIAETGHKDEVDWQAQQAAEEDDATQPAAQESM